MAHTRIRTFNTRDTYPEQNLDNDLAQAVVTRGGRIVWLRGQCPQNLDDARTIASHDPVEQTHKVMQNIRQLIEEAGGRMDPETSRRSRGSPRRGPTAYWPPPAARPGARRAKR